MTHRTESRMAIAECKAEKTKSGGDAINKFVGSLDVERRKRPDVQISGYFVALAGFTETTHEQEEEVGGNRVVLLDGARVVAELIKGRILVSPEQAMERAGRCVADSGGGLQTDESMELLAHKCGWIWVVYYVRGKERTHFSLIHADGDLLAYTLAKQIMRADKLCGGSLHTLEYLGPKRPTANISRNTDSALAKYQAYLANECGVIVFDGLPPDRELATRRLKLESLFVPLHLEACLPLEEEGKVGSTKVEPERRQVATRESAGKVLSTHNRMAILASAGSANPR